VILQASSQVVAAAAQGARPSMLQGLASGVKLQMYSTPRQGRGGIRGPTIERMIGGLRFFSMDSQIADGEGDQGTQSLADFAILCRTTAQMPAIEKALHDHSIPFQRVGQESFFRQEPVRTAIDVLRLAASGGNPFLQERLASRGSRWPSG